MRPLRTPCICPVAGVSFRQEVVMQCRVGERVVIAATDENPHDADAVEVRRRGGELLGFIPRALAPRLRSSGERVWDGEVAEVLRGETWGLRVTVRGPVAGTSEHDSAPPTADPAVHPGGDAPEPGVYSMSGRELGQLSRLDGDAVIVRTPHGEQRYPRRLVRLQRAG